MTYSNSLADFETPLVLDTSVLINLHASMCGGCILDALPNQILVPENVAIELDHEASRAKGALRFTQDLVAATKAQIAYLNDQEYEVFEGLLRRFSLGDGEAATIAIASCRGLQPVIDERKGRTRAQELKSKPGWSLDLFRNPAVVAIVGEKASADALYLALRDGRMRIHEEHCDYVVSVIGYQHALDCISLPGYRARQSYWRKLALQAEATGT